MARPQAPIRLCHRLIIFLLFCGSIELSRCEDSTKDEDYEEKQFQVYHHDISRISTSRSQSHIAPQSIIRKLESGPEVIQQQLPEPRAIAAPSPIVPLQAQLPVTQAPPTRSKDNSVRQSVASEDGVSQPGGRTQQSVKQRNLDSPPSRSQVSRKYHPRPPTRSTVLARPRNQESFSTAADPPVVPLEAPPTFNELAQAQPHFAGFQAPSQLVGVSHQLALAPPPPPLPVVRPMTEVAARSAGLLVSHQPLRPRSRELHHQRVPPTGSILQLESPTAFSLGPPIDLSESQEAPARGPSGDSSVSAAHSALMAEVAAERQRAAQKRLVNHSSPQSGELSGSQGGRASYEVDPAVTQLSAPPAGRDVHEANKPHFRPVTRKPLAAAKANARLPKKVQEQQVAHQTQSSPPPPQSADHTATLEGATSHLVADQSRAEATEVPQVPPPLEQVLQQGCPPVGLFSYGHKDFCDRYHLCTNGTLTEETCPNGLAYSQLGAIYQHCAYNWNVDCASKKTPLPVASPGCPWQFGIFPIESAGHCSLNYFVCEWGVPETRRCSPEGLFYDDRIKGCQWADQLGCNSEKVLRFTCPPEDEQNPYWPYPRYYHSNNDIIVCVNEQPRLVHCTDEQRVDPSALACIDLNPKKRKKKQASG